MSADGSYTFEGLQAGTYTVYAASSYSSERAVCTNVVVRATETTVADVLKLTATGSITGTVTIDGNASGNTGFLVFVAGTSYMAMTDNAGNYVISGVPAGKGYQVVATKNGVIHNLSSSVTVTANGSATMANNNFTSTELDTNGKDGADGKDGINGTDGKDGIDGTDGKDGIDGISMVWLGEFDSADEIENPKYLNAYFNKTDGCSYIYTGTKWTLLARSGANGTQGEKGDSGTDGKSINWRGSYTSSDYISNPQYLDAYYNMTDGCSYIYTSKGEWAEWTLLASKGEQGEQGIQGEKGDSGTDGKSINWLGSYASSDEISNPQYLDAYFNTTDGCSYIYASSGEWQKLSAKGEKGDTGENGDDGVSIVWLGSYADSSEIEEPQLLNAYFNITDGCSYIYNGTEWTLLARKGADGATSSSETGITWRGSFASASEISNPAALDAFYNTSTGCSYIYNGSSWQLFAKAGTNGKDGVGINWLGNYSSANQIYSPQYLDAYWNTTENCAYIYSGARWTVLAKGPASGGSGSSSTNIGSEEGAIISGTVLTGWKNPEGVIRIPNGVTNISQDVFYSNDSITKVIIPSSVVSIGAQAFWDCDGLTSVEIYGSGLQIIGAKAFYHCSALASINLPSSLLSIGEEAFYNCKNLITVNIPNKVVAIGKSAYQDCTSLMTLTIGSGVTTLEEYTFRNCDSLTSVTIPTTVKTINDQVFADCDSLVTVSVSGRWSKDSTTNHVLTIDDLKNTSYYDGEWTRD